MADFKDVAPYLSEGELQEASSSILTALADNTLNKLYLKNIKDTVDVIQDSERYGPSYVNNLVSRLVPLASLQKNIKSVQYDGIGEVNDWVDALKKSYIGADPLRRKTDAFGYEIKREATVLENVFGFKNTQAPEHGEARRELAMHRKVPNNRSKMVEGVKLTPDEFFNYKNNIKEFGTLEKITDLIKSPQYLKAPHGIRSKYLDKVLGGVRKYAKLKAMSEDPDLAGKLRDTLLYKREEMLKTDINDLNRTYENITDANKNEKDNLRRFLEGYEE
jgi:hypothetical protein